MFLEVFKLKKTSWHMRLMTFVWGYNYYDFSNMCPYFWLSVFNVTVALPIYVPLKLLWRGGIAAIDAIGDIVNPWIEAYERRCYEADRAYREKVLESIRNCADRNISGEVPDKDNLVETWFRHSKLSKNNPMYMPLSNKKALLMHEAVNDYFNSTNWRRFSSLYDQFNEKYSTLDQKRYDEKERRDNAARVAKIERAKAIGKLTVAFKKIFTVVGILLATGVTLGIAYLLYRLVRWTTTWPWTSIGKWGLIVIASLVILVLAMAAVWYTGKLIRYLWCTYGEYCVPCKERADAILKVMGYVLAVMLYPFINLFPLVREEGDDPKPGPISWLFISLFKGFVVAIEFLVALKNNNCPAVEWED